MKIDDDSFKKPGAIPFKWEIRPGVPKQPRADDPNTHVGPESPKLQHKSNQSQRKRSVTSSPKLKPPPSGLNCSNHTIILNPKENNSIKSSPRTRSLRVMNLMRQPDVVSSSSSCFPSPSSVKRRGERTKRINYNDYYSDSDGDDHHRLQQQRWSVSSRRSAVSASPLSSSFASYRSSPRLVNDDDVDAEWVNAVLMHF